MGNAFPPKPGCNVPQIPAIGPLLVSTNLDDPPQPIYEFPMYEYPIPNLPSADFGCTSPKTHVVSTGATPFGVTVTPDAQRGSCVPTFNFDVDIPACVCINTKATIKTSPTKQPTIKFKATRQAKPCFQTFKLDIAIPQVTPNCDCQVATTENLDGYPFSGYPKIDNYQTKYGDSVLVKDQDDKTQNGVYVIGAKPGGGGGGSSASDEEDQCTVQGNPKDLTMLEMIWTKKSELPYTTEPQASTNFDESPRDMSRDGVVWNRYCTLASGLLVSIAMGDTNGGTVWMLTNDDPITPGTTPLHFTEVGDDCCCSARAATYGTIGLTGLPTVDGVALKDGDILLVRNQNGDLTASTDNGCYIVHDTENWVRTCALRAGLVVSVREGKAFGRTLWMLVTADPLTTDPTTGKLTTAIQYNLIHSGHIAVTAACKDNTHTTVDDVDLATGDLFVVYSTGANANPDCGIYGIDDSTSIQKVMLFDLTKEPTVLGLSVSVAQGTVFGHGEFIVIDSNKVKPVGPNAYVIISIQEDYLTCQDTDGDKVYIAKPPLLRKATTDGYGNNLWSPPRNVTNQTYTITYGTYSPDAQHRTATRSVDGYEETQIIVDSYQPNDIIFAVYYDVMLSNR